MIFYYIRHGDPIYNPDSLTPLGHRQAEALSKRLALYGLDEIYASSSTRARQTAEPTCRLLGKEATVLDWANEGHAWRELALPFESEKRRWPFQNPVLIELLHTPEMAALGKEWYKHPALAGMNYEAGVKRIATAADEFLLSLGYRHDSENNRYEAIAPHERRVALFAHQGFGMSFLSHILDIPYPLFSTRFDLGHSSMTVIHFENNGKYVFPKALQVSNDSHLYKEDILTGYQNRLDI